MSRANTKTARDLRDNESLQLRKQILKSVQNNIAYNPNNELFQQISDTGSQYLDRIAELKKFRNKSKTVTKSVTQKGEWISEQGQLQNMSYKIEREVSGLLESLLTACPNDSEVMDLIATGIDNDSDRGLNQKTVISQLKDVKVMMKETLKGILKMKENVNNSNNLSNSPLVDKSEGEEDNNDDRDREETIGPYGVWGASVSIFADILLQMRSSHNDNWNSMKEEETNLFNLIKSGKILITHSLRSDLLIEQNEKLKKDFELTEEDDEEVEMFMVDWIQKVNSLDEDYNKDMKELVAERRYENEQLDLLEGENDTYGGWKEEDHDVFAKIYRRAITNGTQRKVFMSTLETQLPHISPEFINKHEIWYRAIKSITAKRKDLVSKYTLNRDNLLKQAKEELILFRESHKNEILREQQLKEHERQRSFLHLKLDELRLSKQKIQGQLLEEEKKNLAEQYEKSLLESEKERIEIEEKKARIINFKFAKQQLLDAEKRREEMRLKEEEENRKKLIEMNKPKVELREQKRLDKEEEKLRKEEEIMRQEQVRLELLMRLAEQVPYWESMQNATSKLDHITASVKSHAYLGYEEQTRGFLPLNGFTDKKVISDARFRLATALRSAGVQNSNAARDVVKSNFVRPHLAIHGII